MLTCPRRMVEVGPWERSEGLDSWVSRDGYQVCSFCGCLHPDKFFDLVESGAEVGPTDKNYKAYIQAPNPKAGQIVEVGRSSGPVYDLDGNPMISDPTIWEKVTGSYDRAIMGRAPSTLTLKFYFQHLSEEQCKKFIELHNSGVMKLGYPGHFYRPPYFARLAPENGEQSQP